MQRPKTIVVSAVNLRKGGTLTVLRRCLEYLSGLSGEYRIVALVHDRSICDFRGIEYVEMPWCTKSWAHRLWAEYVSMNRISRRICAPGGIPYLWLSLHDTTPCVRAEHRAVYCHTSFPFMRIRLRDFMMDPKIPLFSLLTKYYYRFNVHDNDHLIVQQDWFRSGIASLTGFPESGIIVAPPSFSQQPIAPSGSGTVPVFLYPSTPDCHKNFEVLCAAAEMLESRTGTGHFRVVMTIDGTENRYSRWLRSRWGHVRSIEFAGLMKRDTLYSYYSEAACLVFPSRVESWGLPISEFLPSGKPMILPDLPYAHETASGASKVAFFDPDGAEFLAALIESFIVGDMDMFGNVPEIDHAQPFVNGWQELFEMLLK